MSEVIMINVVHDGKKKVLSMPKDKYNEMMVGHLAEDNRVLKSKLETVKRILRENENLKDLDITKEILEFISEALKNQDE